MTVVKMPAGWADPIDLPGLPPVAQWSDALLPDALRPWICDVADRTQCPPEYAAVGAVVGLASVIGRGCAIRPKRYDDWTVVPNLWGGVVGPPSAMKTPALREALRPLQWLASQSSRSHADRAFEREQIEAKKKALHDQMKKQAKNQIVDISQYRERHDEDDRLRRQFEDIEAQAEQADAERRFVVYDTTVEKLGELLAQSPRGLLLFRDELVGWLATLDKGGRENDRSFYLESWAGDHSYIYDRISRGTIEIDCACMSILGGIQPGPLAGYMRAATAGGAGSDGLMQRFQLLVYPDRPREWKDVDRWPNSEARDRARELYVQLADRTAESFNADTFDKIPFVRFDDAAQELFSSWHASLLNRARSGEEHEAIEAHLVKYGSLLPSLALIFQLVDVGHGPVQLPATERAAAWCTLLESHMRRVYASVSASKYTTAKTLLGKLKAGKLPNPFTSRDAYRPQWAGLTEPAEIEAAIDFLEEHGWVRRETVATGGRPRVEVHVHPAVGRG